MTTFVYVYKADTPTRVRVKKWQNKITVNPWDVIESDIDLSKTAKKLFVGASLDNIKEIQDKITLEIKVVSSLEDSKKIALKNLKSEYEASKEQIEEEFKSRKIKSDEKVAILEKLLVKITDWVDSLIKKLDWKKDEIAKQQKELQGFLKDTTKEEKKSSKKAKEEK